MSALTTLRPRPARLPVRPSPRRPRRRAPRSLSSTTLATIRDLLAPPAESPAEAETAVERIMATVRR